MFAGAIELFHRSNKCASIEVQGAAVLEETQELVPVAPARLARQSFISVASDHSVQDELEGWIEATVLEAITKTDELQLEFQSASAFLYKDVISPQITGVEAEQMRGQSLGSVEIDAHSVVKPHPPIDLEQYVNDRLRIATPPSPKSQVCSDADVNISLYNTHLQDLPKPTVFFTQPDCEVPVLSQNWLRGPHLRGPRQKIIRRMMVGGDRGSNQSTPAQTSRIHRPAMQHGTPLHGDTFIPGKISIQTTRFSQVHLTKHRPHIPSRPRMCPPMQDPSWRPRPHIHSHFH